MLCKLYVVPDKCKEVMVEHIEIRKIATVFNISLHQGSIQILLAELAQAFY
jgi:hypothetical protein